MAVITPAKTLVGPVRAYCARLESMSRATLLKLGLDGQGLAPNAAESALGITAGSIAAQALQMALDGFTTFEYDAQTETNDALVINLTDDLGIDFLTAGTFRRVDIDIYGTGDADANLITKRSVVAGGTTPVVATTLATAVATTGLTTIETSRVFQVASGDWLNSGAVRDLIVVSQSSNDVIATLTGISNFDAFYKVKVQVYPLVSQTFPATD